MTETYGIFDSADGDARTYAASVLCGILAKLLRDGVVHGDGGELAVSASDPPAMSVLVGTGTALIRGRYYQNDAALSLAIAAADPANPRIDRAVLRLNATPARTIRAVILQGTPAPAPVAPALTRTSETWELSLAQVRVEAGATSIGSSKIIDERGDASLCGDAVPAWVPSSQIGVVGDVDAGGHRVVSLGAPTGAADAATKEYTDGEIAAKIGGFGIGDIAIDVDKDWQERQISNVGALRSAGLLASPAPAPIDLAYRIAYKTGSISTGDSGSVAWYPIGPSYTVPLRYSTGRATLSISTGGTAGADKLRLLLNGSPIEAGEIEISPGDVIQAEYNWYSEKSYSIAWGLYAYEVPVFPPVATE